MGLHVFSFNIAAISKYFAGRWPYQDTFLTYMYFKFTEAQIQVGSILSYSLGVIIKQAMDHKFVTTILLIISALHKLHLSVYFYDVYNIKSNCSIEPQQHLEPGQIGSVIELFVNKHCLPIYLLWENSKRHLRLKMQRAFWCAYTFPIRDALKDRVCQEKNGSKKLPMWPILASLLLSCL